MPREFGVWSTVHNRFRQWRDAGVFETLLEGLIAEAAKRDEVDLKAWRGIATRYDKTPQSYLAGLHLRASMIWVKDLTRTA